MIGAGEILPFFFAMKNYLLNLCFLLFAVSAGYGQTFEFKGVSGGSGSLSARWRSCATDNEGNTYLAGEFLDSIIVGDSLILRVNNINSGSTRLWLIKLDKNGIVIWKKVSDEYYIEYSDIGNPKLQIDSDGNILLVSNSIVTFESDTFQFPIGAESLGHLKVVRISKYGQIIDKKLFSSELNTNTNRIFCENIAISKKKEIYISGYYVGDFLFRRDNNSSFSLRNIGSKYNGFVLKMDSTFQPLWARNFYHSSEQDVLVKNIALDNDNNVIAVGSFRDTLFLDSNKVTYQRNPLNTASDNGWIAKLDEGGNLMWSKILYSPAASSFESVSTDSYNNLYFSGNGSDQNAYYTSDTGNVFGKQMGILFNKFDSDGNPIWIKSTDIDFNLGIGSGLGRFTQVDSAGNLYLAGSFTGRVDFDPGLGSKIFIATNTISPSYFPPDMFLAKYTHTGAFMWLARTNGTTYEPGAFGSFSLDQKSKAISFCGDYAGILRFGGQLTPSFTSRFSTQQPFQTVTDGFYGRLKNNCITRTQIYDTICFGTTKAFDGETLTKSGKYIRLKSYNPANQCEVWEELYLHVRPEIQASAGADASVCSGKSQQLGTDSLGGLSYQWLQVGGNFTSTLARPKPGYTNFSDSIQRYRFALQVTDSKGCQKLDTVQLAISPVLRASLAKTICPGVTFEGYSTGGTYKDTLVSNLGCDSIRTLTLNFDIPNNSIQLSAEFGALGAPGQDGYQWLDCNAGFAPIPGETDSSFAPTVSGSYAVKVTKGSCADTSSCLFITSSSKSIANSSELEIFPNPNTGKATVRWKAGKPGDRVLVSSLEGKVVLRLELNTDRKASFQHLPAGVYVLKPEKDGPKPVRVMVE